MTNKFTLIIPTYNEAKIISDTLHLVCARLAQLEDVDWKVIVVDNASTDGTADIVEQLNDPRVSAMRLTEKGRGRAVRAGFSAVNEGIIGFTDSDLSVSPDEIVTAYKKIQNEEYDIVIGNRFSADAYGEGRLWRRHVTSIIFRFLARNIVGIRAKDMQCPLKIANESSLPVMLATIDTTWFNDLEFVALAERLQLRILEFPVAWDEGRYPDRKSKLKLFQDGFRAVLAMFEIRRRLPEQLHKLQKELR